jgi:hypothetical protein
METVFLLVFTYEVVKMLGGPLLCVQYCLVLILFDGYSIYLYYIRSGRKADCNFVVISKNIFPIGKYRHHHRHYYCWSYRYTNTTTITTTTAKSTTTLNFKTYYNVDSKRFWRWCITQRNSTFPSSGILENTTFRKLDLFPSSGKGGGEDTYLVGPLKKI